MNFRSLTLALSLLVNTAAADTPENALLAQSIVAWEAAQQAANPVDRLEALQSAQSSIETILKDHAESDLAVGIVLGGGDLLFTRTDLQVAIAAIEDEIEQERQNREVNSIIVMAVRILEDAVDLAPADREAALHAYLMTREAVVSISNAAVRFPLAVNLGLLENSDLLSNRFVIMEKAAALVAELCHGHRPQSCMFLEIERFVAGIENDFHRASQLFEIAREQAKAGQFADAERVAAGIEVESSRVSAMRAIATALAEAGQFVEAERVVAEIEDEWDLPLALSAIATALAEAGQFAEAESVAVRIEFEHSLRVPAMMNIAAALAEAGQFVEAERVAAGIKAEHDRVRALISIATALAEMGQMQEAFRLWGEAEHSSVKIEVDLRRASALSSIATGLSEMGRTADASRLWEKAEQEARGFDDFHKNLYVRNSIAVARVKAGQLTEARQFVVEIEDERSRALALRTIAVALAETGRMADGYSILKEAELVAAGIKDRSARTSELIAIAIAAARVKTGDFLEAERFAARIRDNRTRAWAFHSIAAALAEMGQMADASRLWEEELQIVERLKDDSHLGFVLNDIVAARVQAGQLSKARDIAAGIDDELYRSSALRTIVAALN